MGNYDGQQQRFKAKNQQAVLEASEVWKTDVFCIDDIVVHAHKPQILIRSGRRILYIFTVIYGHFYPDFPVLFAYLLRISSHSFQWFVS